MCCWCTGTRKMFVCFLQMQQGTAGTAIRVRVFERRTAGWKATCFRKVPRPAGSIKVFRGFLQSSSKCQIGTACFFSCSPPNNHFKIFRQTQLSQCGQNVGVLQPLKHKPSPHAPKTPIPSVHFCHNACYMDRTSLHFSYFRTFWVPPPLHILK